MGDLSLHDAIHSLQAVRRLAPDPVPEADLRYVIEAATQAASAENRQRWVFLVIVDAGQRQRIGDIYREIGERVIRDQALASGKLPEDEERVYRRAMILVEHMGEAPAQILVASREAPPTHPAMASPYWGSIYPAIQNLMLAARARGLGTTLTTLHKLREDDVKRVVNLPESFETIALIPIGYPAGRFGRPLRKPATEATHWNHWTDRE